MHCATQWQSVFLTKSDYGNETAPLMDDVFVSPMMSVCIRRDGIVHTATPIEDGSEWLMCAFPKDVDPAQLLSLEVGDLVRVGTASVGGFTDYLTIMEIVDVDSLHNTSQTEWQLGAYPTGTPTNHNDTYPTNGSASGGVVDKLKEFSTQSPIQNFVNSSEYLPGAFRAIRVNYSINATTLPPNQPTNSTMLTTRTAATHATRGETSGFHRSTPQAYAGSSTLESMFYPMYKQRKWTSPTQPTRSVLRLQMPTNIKQISAVRLMGYSMVHKRSVGVQQQHESKEDDWFALRFKEVGGDVLSNNQTANGSFHVVHAGNTLAKSVGSIELYDYDANGLAHTSFTPVNLPSLTVDIVDREGKEAHFGRMHLWLQICVVKA